MMAETLYQLIGSLSTYSQGLIHDSWLVSDYISQTQCPTYNWGYEWSEGKEPSRKTSPDK